MTNRDDIEQLFKTHYARVHSLAVALVHDEEAARDIVHDVFESLLDTRFAQAVGAGYLVQAVRNRCMNYLRNCSRHARIANLYFVDMQDYDTEEWPDDETIARIYGIIKSELSPLQRRAMELRFVEGKPFAEVARVMALSETAVYKHVRHALVIIRKRLNEDD